MPVLYYTFTSECKTKLRACETMRGVTRTTKWPLSTGYFKVNFSVTNL
jgi:hypothetical protein